MRKAVKMVSAIILIFMLCINTGCSLFPDGNINNEVEDNDGTVSITENESKHIAGTLVGNVAIDADVKIPENVQWKQYKLIGRQISKEQADEHAKLFASGRDYSEPEFSDYDNIKRYNYKYNDGSHFTDGEDCILYNTDESMKMRYYWFAGYKRSKKMWSNKDEAFPQKSLSGCDLNETIAQVKELCKGLGIEISTEEPDVYVMDAESMNKMVKKYNIERGVDANDEHALKEWTTENEVYYLIFEMALNGTTMESASVETDSKRSHPHWVTAAVGRDGIKEFEAERVYGTETKQELEGALCSVDEAVKVVAAQLQYLTGSNEYSISDIELKYMGLANSDWSEYYARPYWIFSAVSKKVYIKDGVKTEEFNEQKLCVDAVKKTFYIGK